MFLQVGRYRFGGGRSFTKWGRSQQISSLIGRAFCGALLGVAALVPANAQLKAKVTVATGKATAMFYTTSLGVAADRWDDKAYDAATVELLQDAGITSLRFPGNGGTDALYHFSKGTIINPYSDDKVADFPVARQFPAVSQVMEKLGSGIITVNYGSNLDGTGGGEPAEAAAFVAYVNGDASNTQAIGKDSKGNDWKTVGYWATLRGADPLPADDGLNVLRISHSQPFGVLLWTIGHEPYNNGFYGQGHTIGADWKTTGLYGQSYPLEPDLHAGPVPTAKDWGRHTSNAKVGPQAYGAAVVEYVKAMKAVDPKIFIGAALTLPPISNDPNPMGKNWNAGVLKAACGSMDFSAVSLNEGKGAPPQWVDLDEFDLLHGARDPLDAQKHFNQDAIRHDYALLATELADKYKKFCPAGHAPQVAITSLSVGSWLPAKNPAGVGLFAADAIAMLLENGAYTVDWSPIHGASPTFLDDSNKPQPAFYGIKLFRTAVGPGDSFVAATTSMDDLAVHAVKRRDGGLGLLLVNKVLDRSVIATITVDGYNFAAKGTRYDWGKVASDAGKGIAEAPIEGLGGTFTVEVPRYGITAIVIPKAE
ncbi:MAG TPA: hypothetical protein VGD64_08025 [Acidisarcina sp.]